MELVRTVDYQGRPAWRWDKDTPRYKGYIGNLAEAVSQVLAALIGTHANLTFSAQCGEWDAIGDPRKIFVPIVNLIFRDNDHCRNAWRDKV